MASFFAKSESGAALAGAELRNGDPTSGAEQEVLHLFDALQDRLFRYLTSFMLPAPDAEEIIEDSFLALFQHLRRRGPRDNLKGWLFRVAHHLGLTTSGSRSAMAIAWASRIFGAVQTVEDTVPDPGLNPEDQFAMSQMSVKFMAVVRALPERDRPCLTPRAEGGRSLARISRAAERRSYAA